jgi:AraC family transcriptional regulator
LQHIKPVDYLSQLSKGVLKMEPRIVSKPGFMVVGVKYRGKNENQEIPDLWSEFGARFNDFKHRTEEETAYGVMDNFDHASGEFDYVAAVSISSTEDQPRDLTLWDIPAQTYAVFATTLPKVKETFDAIYGGWLPESDYQRPPGPEFELYDEGFDPKDPESQFDIYIPVKMKS